MQSSSSWSPSPWFWSCSGAGDVSYLHQAQVEELFPDDRQLACTFWPSGWCWDQKAWLAGLCPHTLIGWLLLLYRWGSSCWFRVCRLVRFIFLGVTADIPIKSGYWDFFGIFLVFKSSRMTRSWIHHTHGWTKDVLLNTKPVCIKLCHRLT